MSTSVQLFGSSGIRMIADSRLLGLALEVGLVVGEQYRTVVVGSDTRTSSQAVKHAFIAGLLGSGCQAYDAGMVPTPTLAYAARNFQAGAVITASHNPPEYNGIKLWNPDGSAFDLLQRNQIEEAIGIRNLKTASWEQMKDCQPYTEARAKHIQRILADFNSGRKIKVVLDCVCGAASAITPYLLSRMGCQVLAINSHPSGHFPRAIEPVAENLGELVQIVKATGADLGIAHDGDADRTVVADDLGRVIPGDKLLMMFARSLGARKVVTTVDASAAIEEIGVEVVRTRVGDAFVSEELKKGGDFGGEPAGSWIFPRVSYCPDGIYAAAQVIDLARQVKLSALADEIPSYPMLRGSFPCSRNTMGELESRLDSLRSLAIDRTDGIRLVFDDGWLLIRASGTEPKLRITAEAKTRERAEALYQAGARLVTESAAQE